MCCVSLSAALLACAADPAGVPDATTGPLEPDAAPAAVRYACDDLDPRIDLAGQIAANGDAERPRYPLVLAHGFAGFDRVGFAEYFYQIPETLRAAGYAVYVTAVPPVASTETARGPELGRQVACIVQESGAERVNLVGHSQGGLDVRYVASHREWGAFVASVTTIATPHTGVTFADLVLDASPDLGIDVANALATLYGRTVDALPADGDLRGALESLSRERMVQWNADHPNAPGVPYFSWAGRAVRSALRLEYATDECAGGEHTNPERRDVVDPLMLATFDYLAAVEGPNDGLVPVTVAKWGTFMGCIPADHLDQIGHLFESAAPHPFSGFSHTAFFTLVAEDLAARSL